MIAETRRKGRIYSEIMRLLNEEIGRYIFSVAVTRAVSAAAALWSGGRSGADSQQIFTLPGYRYCGWTLI